jgi:hypothetical protein
MAEGRIRPAGPFALGAAEIEPLPRRAAWSIDSRRRDAEIVGFEIGAPIEPESAGVAARHTLDVAPSFAGKGRFQAGTSEPEAVSVVAVSTQPLELAGVQVLAFAHPLPPATFSAEPTHILNRAAKGVPDGWEAYGRESSTVEFASIQARASGVRWPTATSFQFAPVPEWPARAGRAAKADPNVFTEFAVPAVREPEVAGYQPGLGSAPVTRLAVPTVRQDAATTQIVAHLAPVFRPHRHPSRLPVFHANVEKAHMPSGVFNYVEFEDWDDERTMERAAPHPAAQAALFIPSIAFAPHGRENLDESPMLAVYAGPYTRMETPAGGHGELPFAFEIVVVPSGAELVRMDFESIAETYEPRWRSALKSASGLFRGVLMVLCVVALAGLGSGCSGRGHSLKESLQSRAAISLEHNFSAGFDGWFGAGDWTGSWSRNPGGFAQVGSLALYRPSQQLSNYRFEFLGQITGRTMGWVFRAADLQNYYATQLTIVKPGALPEVALVRYQVVGGQATDRVQIPLRIFLQTGRPYRIREDVAGSGFTTSVEGEVVDSWTDDRLRAGAVGFFGGPQDRPNVYWMKVTNNDDFWGKVCGILAPSN